MRLEVTLKIGDLSEFDQALDGEFLRKRAHTVKLLAMHGLPSDVRSAHLWVRAFSDEADPSATILDWISGGWRDPRLVDAALRICGERGRAERCFAALRIPIDINYVPGVELWLSLVNAAA
jgi:hypothetical protein